MGAFLRKPIVWVIFFVLLIVALITLLFYPFNRSRLFTLPVVNNTNQPLPVKKPGPCLILEEKYCNTGELLETQVDGETFFLIGLNLPVDTPIFAPVNGQVFKTEIQPGSTFKGFYALIDDPNVLSPSVPPFVLRGDIKFPDMINANVNAGNQIGSIQDTGISNLGYNLIIVVATPAENPNNLPPPRTTLEKYFPQAFDKPAKQVDLATLPPPQPIYTGPVYN